MRPADPLSTRSPLVRQKHRFPQTDSCESQIRDRSHHKQAARAERENLNSEMDVWLSFKQHLPL